MVRIFPVVLALLPLVAALRGGDSDAEASSGPRSPRILARTMHSVIAKDQGGAALDGHEDGYVHIEGTSLGCDNGCSSTPCDLPNDSGMGISACFGGSDFCIVGDDEFVWGHACRAGFSCGTCKAVDPCHTDCTGSCDDVGVIEVCDTVTESSLCIDSQTTWRTMCRETGATCGACGVGAPTNTLGDNINTGGCNVDGMLSGFCNIEDADVSFIYDEGNGGMKIANCGQVHEMCTTDPCSLQTVSNLLFEGEAFTLNCITLVTPNSGLSYQNFLNGCCQSTDATYGSTPGDREDSTTRRRQ